jgi:hypothetical protein
MGRVLMRHHTHLVPANPDAPDGRAQFYQLDAGVRHADADPIVSISITDYIAVFHLIFFVNHKTFHKHQELSGPSHPLTHFHEASFCSEPSLKLAQYSRQTHLA